MNIFAMQGFRTGSLLLCAWLALFSAPAPAEDIDIFVTNNAAASTFDNPNVLIILDNTSNWSRSDQKWPDGIKQGEAELQAIKSVVATLDTSINVGLMLFTDSGVGREGGYIRFPVMQMTAANKLLLQNLAQYIYDNFQNPSEKTSASADYSSVMFDAFKYFGGYTSPANIASGAAGTPADATHFGPTVFNQRTDATLANVGGYTDATLGTYAGPISSLNSCAKNFVIFIGNGFPNDDMSDMGPYLAGIGGTTTQLSVPGFTTTAVTATTDLGSTSTCYASLAACSTADFATQCASYDSCSCAATTTTTLPACPSGQSRYQVLGNTTSTTTGTTTSTSSASGTTGACYASPPSTAGMTGNQFGMTCPTNTSSGSGGTTTTTSYGCTYTVGGATGTVCAPTITGSSTTNGTPVVTTAASSSCYTSTPSTTGLTGSQFGMSCAASSSSSTTSGNVTTTTTTGENCSYTAGTTTSGAACGTASGTTPSLTQTALTTSCWSPNANAAEIGNDRGGLAAPSPVITINGTTGAMTTTTYTAAFAWGNPSTTTGCGSGRKYTVTMTLTSAAVVSSHYAITQTRTPYTTTTTSTPNYQYVVTQNITATTSTTTTSTSSTNLGNTFACYASPPTGTPTDFSCTGYSSCSFGGTTSSAACPSGARYLVQGNAITNQVVSNNTYAVPPTNKQRMTDEWARYLYQTDVASPTGKQNVSTYTIDVFNAKQDADQTALLMSMARAGGGKYFSANNQSQIISALKQIMSEIQAVNTVFASASLPVNATNRAQNENQVFIGMFRPDPAASPRWYGNVKRYQLANFAGVIDLADVNGRQAVNLQTGFVSECATSWWTSDSGSYWQSIPNNPPAQGTCTTGSFGAWSDSPDGPLVEKGATAEVIRKGNNPTTTDSAPTWAPNRNVKTLSGTTFVDFTAANTGLAQSLVDFIVGKDVNDENANGLTTTETRPSLHGDVIHSRPLPVNYATAANLTAGVTVYYGANDGTLRAMNASNGKERWAFVAPEFLSRLSRLKDNSPLVRFPNQPIGITPTPTPKNYYWDGSVGVYQTLDNSSVWIYPTMRRGGRMLYGLDVTTPDSPTVLWKKGCPNLTDDADCTTGLTGIGQTWSLPNVAFIKGYSTTEPVIIVGGGYDPCEDTNTSSPPCASPKGAAVYVFKASDGSLLKSLTFSGMRSVPSDVAMVDVDNDGFVDYAYVGDTGGNLFRVDFVDGAASYAALDPADWAIYRVAYTTGTDSPVPTAPRKFFFPPALFFSGGGVYVAVGSGDREHPLQGDYPYTDTLNRFYVYLDRLLLKPTTTAEAIDLDDVSLLNNNTGSTSCNSDKILASSEKRGWFMDLNQYGQGEQTVTSALILGGLVTFSTNRPVPPAVGSCTTTLGEARGYWVNLLNASGGIGVGSTGTCGGTRSAVFVGGGLPPSPVTGVVPVGGTSQAVVIGAVQRDGSASAPIGGQKVVPTIQATRRRVYWFKNIDN